VGQLRATTQTDAPTIVMNESTVNAMLHVRDEPDAAFVN
jgi:hypothetical protein